MTPLTPALNKHDETSPSPRDPQPDIPWCASSSNTLPALETDPQMTANYQIYTALTSRHIIKTMQKKNLLPMQTGTPTQANFSLSLSS